MTARTINVKISYDFDGTIRHTCEGNLLHCDGGPALIESNGAMHWFQYGKRHRENGPAVIYSDGTLEYWVNGKQHREDGPAVITRLWSAYYYNDQRFFSYKEFEEHKALICIQDVMNS